MNNADILTVAIQAREAFDKNAFSVQYVQGLVEKHLSYIAEGYKDELPSWIEQTLTSFPINGCELAAVVLLDRLKSGKIVYGRYDHEPVGLHNRRKSHTFWMQDGHDTDNLIIADITADQYGGPPVYVGTLKHPWTMPEWSKMQ